MVLSNGYRVSNKRRLGSRCKKITQYFLRSLPPLLSLQSYPKFTSLEGEIWFGWNLHLRTDVWGLNPFESLLRFDYMGLLDTASCLTPTPPWGSDK